MDTLDIVNQQDNFISFRRDFFLNTKKWKSISNYPDFNWYSLPFTREKLAEIPEAPGIYTFVINPKYTNHPQRYLCYIGKADSLKKRYRDYLSERNRESGRPKIIRLLIKWERFIEFTYTLIEKQELNRIESDLIDAFIPPSNERVSSEVHKIKGAF